MTDLYHMNTKELHAYIKDNNLKSQMRGYSSLKKGDLLRSLVQLTTQQPTPKEDLSRVEPKTDGEFVSKPKKSRDPTLWSLALKKFNEENDSGLTIPKKGTPQYEEVLKKKEEIAQDPKYIEYEKIKEEKKKASKASKTTKANQTG